MRYSPIVTRECETLDYEGIYKKLDESDYLFFSELDGKIPQNLIYKKVVDYENKTYYIDYSEQVYERSYKGKVKINIDEFQEYESKHGKKILCLSDWLKEDKKYLVFEYRVGDEK